MAYLSHIEGLLNILRHPACTSRGCGGSSAARFASGRFTPGGSCEQLLAVATTTVGVPRIPLDPSLKAEDRAVDPRVGITQQPKVALCTYVSLR
jgi:hypothetical protein